MAEASLRWIIFIKWTWKAIYKARVVFVRALRWGRKGANSIISSSLGWQLVSSLSFKNQLLLSLLILRGYPGLTPFPRTMPSLSFLPRGCPTQLQELWPVEVTKSPFEFTDCRMKFSRGLRCSCLRLCFILHSLWCFINWCFICKRYQQWRNRR